LVLVFFGEAVLRLWLGDVGVAAAAAPMLSLLALGVLLHGLLHVPHILAMARGCLRFGLCANVVAVLLYFPVLLWWSDRAAATGAAAAWVVLHAANLLVGMQFFYRVMLPDQKWAWYGWDVALPLTVASSACLALRWLLEDPAALGLIQLGLVGLLLVAILLVVMPDARAHWRRARMERKYG
jgi:hypothetical protein